MKKGKLFVFSGPSGVGKGTIVKRILEETDVQFSVSMTTRKPREGEVNGESYYFVSPEEFQKTVDEDGFLEHAVVYGNRYGTPKKQAYERMDAGIDVLLDIDIQGATNVKKACPDGIFIFILPPSIEELERRIKGRGSETEESLRIRLGSVPAELDRAREYDYCVVNGNLDEAVENVKAIIRAEHAKFSENFLIELLNKEDV